MVLPVVLTAALCSTGLISLAPNLLLLLFPNYASNEGESNHYLSLGQTLAAGGLLGDVFLHTLPHASNMEQDLTGLYVLLGFTIFFLADMIIRSLGGGHEHDAKASTDSSKEEHDHSDHAASVILLNLAADALHNFTDGLAIGASFSIQKDVGKMSFASLVSSRGGLTTISIMLHEIPHELGDFCTLVRNGYSKRQAIMAQFGTAIAALVGTVLGVYAVEWGGERLLWITAGGFVYLACVTILPEVLEDGSSVRFRLAQIIAFLLGVSFLFAVSLQEGHDHGHGSSHSHQHEHMGHEHYHGHHHDHHAHGHDHADYHHHHGEHGEL